LGQAFLSLVTIRNPWADEKDCEENGNCKQCRLATMIQMMNTSANAVLIVQVVAHSNLQG
jgi:hypothetical protein